MRIKHLSRPIVSVTFTAFLFSLNLFISCGKDTVEEKPQEIVKPKEDPPKTPPSTKPTKIDPAALIQSKTTLVKSVISVQNEELDEGIYYTNLKYVNSSDKNMSMHIIFADFGYSKIMLRL